MALGGGLCLALAALGALYLALAVAMVARMGRPPAAATRRTASLVTVLKPLCGAAPTLREDLLTFLRQDYAGAVQFVFGVQNNADPAIAVVEDLRRALPDRDITLVVDATLHGSNRKVSNLVNMSRAAQGDVLVLSDDDMRVAPDYLTRVVAALHEPGTGAVTCLYHGVAARGAWSELARLGVDTHFLPNVAVGLGLGLATPCFGSTIALRTEILERIGGFAAVADDLADDYELGRRVRALGLTVGVPAFTIGHVSAERDLDELARQELRWARTIRQIDPAGHAGSVVSHPLAFAVIACCAVPGPASLGAAALAVALRLALCLAVERRFGLRPHTYWLIPVRDLLSFGLFVMSFAGRGVSWRGHSYGVSTLGALVPKPEP